MPILTWKKLKTTISFSLKCKSLVECISVYWVCAVPGMPEEEVGSPETGVAGGWVLVIKPMYSAREARVLDYWASLQPKLHALYEDVIWYIVSRSTDTDFFFCFILNSISGIVLKVVSSLPDGLDVSLSSCPACGCWEDKHMPLCLAAFPDPALLIHFDFQYFRSIVYCLSHLSHNYFRRCQKNSQGLSALRSPRAIIS